MRGFVTIAGLRSHPVCRRADRLSCARIVSRELAILLTVLILGPQAVVAQDKQWLSWAELPGLPDSLSRSPGQVGGEEPATEPA